MKAAFLIIYIIFYSLCVLIFDILYSARQNEVKLFSEKLQAIPLRIIRLLKLIPTLIVVIFVAFSIPTFNIFYILFLVAFLLCFLGDLGIIFNLFAGLGLFLLAHLSFATAYTIQITNFSLEQMKTNFTFIFVALIVLSLFIILIFYNFLFRKSLLEKFSKPNLIKTILFVYLSIVYFHVLTSFIFAYNYYFFSPGIIVIILGSLFFLISDLIISIRECHHKPKYSVFWISTSYYIALICISFLTQFYQ